MRLVRLGPGETLGIPDQAASLGLAGLARRLAVQLAASGAEVVVTHAYEGGHPDHDATAFAVHAMTIPYE
jgi:LmbE family N-acetylglucosaminyl deacetylase